MFWLPPLYTQYFSPNPFKTMQVYKYISTIFKIVTVLLKTYVEYIRNVKFIKKSKLNMFITAACVLFLIKQWWSKNKSLYV